MATTRKSYGPAHPRPVRPPAPHVHRPPKPPPKRRPHDRLRSHGPSAEGLVVRLHATDQTSEQIRKHALYDDFLFQCPPLETFKPSYGFTHNDLATVGGQISMPSVRNLRTVTFDTLLVDHGSYQVAPYLAPGQHPAQAMRQIEHRLIAIVESGTPFRLYAFHRGALKSGAKLLLGAVHELVGVDGHPGWLATMRSLSIEERHGEGDARYITAEFHEFVDPVALARQRGRRYPIHHKLTAKDTLYSLSRHFYAKTGTPYLNAIRGAQRKKLGKLRARELVVGPRASTRPLAIKLGTTILIPAPPAAKHKARR